MKKKLLCPRNEVCVFFLTDYISFLVSPTCRRLGPLSPAVSDDCIWAFTHLHLPLFLLFIFFFFLKQSVALQPGWPGTHATHPSLGFFVLLLPKLPCAGIDYRDILGFIFVFNYYDVFKKVLQFLQIPYQITQEEPDVQRDLKSCSGSYSQLWQYPEYSVGFADVWTTENRFSFYSILSLSDLIKWEL